MNSNLAGYEPSKDRGDIPVNKNMKKIVVTRHALKRYMERGNPNAQEDSIVKMFRKGASAIEPAWRGKEIVECGGYVWVVERTHTKVTVATCYGKLEEYKVKQPDKVGNMDEVAYTKWIRTQRKRKGRG